MDLEDKKISIQTIIVNIVVCFYLFFFYLQIKKFFYNKDDNKKSIIENKKIKLVKLEDDIELLDKKIKLLQDDNIDTDILDEELRKSLNYQQKNETILNTFKDIPISE
ncbi:MAG: hypothetical protein Ta2D_06270 [Rickettsiales bacterium]|nr:MAG: hypothetical protein Ta2D_06270 [Rickettsiales bacterium]